MSSLTKEERDAVWSVLIHFSEEQAKIGMDAELWCDSPTGEYIYRKKVEYHRIASAILRDVIEQVERSEHGTYANFRQQLAQSRKSQT